MATQKNIADTLGVSVSLVSRALSGKAGMIGITDETVRKVHETASQLGYVPNVAARVLKGGASLTIGVVVFDFEDPFFGSIIGNLQRLAHREQLSLILAGFERRNVHAGDLDPLLRHRLDGLIVVGSEPVSSWVDSFVEQGVTIVRIGTGPGPEPFHRVGVDNEAGVRVALRHLHALGHRTVGTLAAPILPHRRRIKGFHQLAQEEGVQHREEWSFTAGDSVFDAGEAACTAMVERLGDKLPTALFASSDLVAMGAINVLTNRGFRVPDDVSVIGFDDIPFARLSNPSLTTIRQPVDRLTDEAFNLVQQGCANIKEPMAITLKPELIARDSTCAPPERKS